MLLLLLLSSASRSGCLASLVCSTARASLLFGTVAGQGSHADVYLRHQPSTLECRFMTYDAHKYRAMLCQLEFKHHHRRNSSHYVKHCAGY